MATSLFLIAAAVALLISPASSLTCTSQTFPQINTNYTNCTDLPTLKAFLHWTYNPDTRPDPTLEIAFIAPPTRPEGWIAWALNPTGSGMLGAQSLVAFRDTNGSIVVRTYNIRAYGPIVESRISYEVLSRRGEYSDGVMRIFATLAVPSAGGEVNQVWQVGASVRDGVPVRHDMVAENLNSKSKLLLSASGSGAVAGRQTQTGGCSRVWGSGLELYGVLVLLGIWIFVF
ncbi:hypothetical protein ACJIZ3_017744 [Penstemon smallii]|uniref:DOMON domain-containing protein n=1 Tax=Penstemon smallii TaxID=265156 RepID=A0ABD3SWH0_9LAMI